MRRERENLSVNPSMATHFPSLSKGLNVDPDVRMFTEDVHVGIMPIGGKSDKHKGFSVEFLGAAEDRESAKEIIRRIGEFNKYNDAEIVCDAIDNLAKHLAWDGKAFFEIIEKGGEVYINSFTSKNLFKVFFWYLQIIPLEDRFFWGRRFSIVNKKKVWSIEIPGDLGGNRGYKKLLKKLEKYNHLGPGFYRQDLESGEYDKGFDFLKYVRGIEIYFNNVTRVWGWNRRDWSQSKCTEFYTFHRMLGLKYAQALLREYIIEEINRLFVRLEIKCELIVSGLPAPNDILKMKYDMKVGEISFVEVSNKVTV